LLETVNAAALRIDPRHDVADRAVLARRVCRLKNHQHGVPVRGPVKPLQRSELADMVIEKALVLILRLVDGVDLGRPFIEIDLIAFGDSEFL
jgi:hypothetical protein